MSLKSILLITMIVKEINKMKISIKCGRKFRVKKETTGELSTIYISDFTFFLEFEKDMDMETFYKTIKNVAVKKAKELKEKERVEAYVQVLSKKPICRITFDYAWTGTGKIKTVKDWMDNKNALALHQGSYWMNVRVG